MTKLSNICHNTFFVDLTNHQINILPPDSKAKAYSSAACCSLNSFEHGPALGSTESATSIVALAVMSKIYTRLIRNNRGLSKGFVTLIVRYFLKINLKKDMTS